MSNNTPAKNGRRGDSVRRLVLAALFLALCMVLPFLTGGIPVIGNAISPMHIPVLICGFVCGWPYGLAVGFIAPLLRFAIFGMPPLFPTGVAMAFELAAYGALTGVFYKLLPKKIPYLYLSLVLAMLGGRVVWGVVRLLIAGLSGAEFGWAMFMSGAFLTAVPGIIIHIILVPLVVLLLKKARLMPNA